MTKVLINPGFDAFYYSFYYEGLRTVFGEKQLTFTYKPFPSLGPECMALIIDGSSPKRVLIDAYDGAKITNFNGLNWCDVHGKVNLVSSIVPEEYRQKSVAIGPSFPVQLWSFAQNELALFEKLRAQSAWTWRCEIALSKLSRAV
jgi:hypothetical protein